MRTIPTWSKGPMATGWPRPSAQEFPCSKSMSGRALSPGPESAISVTKGQSASRDLFSLKHDRTVNLPPLPAIFPTNSRRSSELGVDGEPELAMARCGMPGPPDLAAAL